MSKLPKIVKDLTGDDYAIDEDLKRLEGKTIKKVRRGIGKTVKNQHQSDVVHIEFTDGEIFAIHTGSNAADPQFESKIEPKDIHVYLWFTWDPDRHPF